MLSNFLKRHPVVKFIIKLIDAISGISFVVSAFVMMVILITKGKSDIQDWHLYWFALSGILMLLTDLFYEE